MSAEAKNWGKPHDLLRKTLCSEIIRQMYGNNHKLVIEYLIQKENSIKLKEEIKKNCLLDDKIFQEIYFQLVSLNIIEENDFINVNIANIFDFILVDVYIQFAEKYYLIPQDRQIIQMLTRQVLISPTLDYDKLMETIIINSPEINKERLKVVLDNLIDKNVFVTVPKNKFVVFNRCFFILNLRIQAITSLIEFQDSRVMDVFKAILDLYNNKPLNQENLKCFSFDSEFLVQSVCSMTDLMEEEVNGVISILASREFSFIDTDNSCFTAEKCLSKYKMKRIGNLLSEIGYPLAKRCVNLLIRHDIIETVKFVDILLMPHENALKLLFDLKTLGVLESITINTQAHLEDNRDYVLWKFSEESAINNSSAYLLGCLGSFYFQRFQERNTNQEKQKMMTLSDSEKKKMDQTIQVMNNTINNTLKKYLDIQWL